MGNQLNLAAGRALNQVEGAFLEFATPVQYWLPREDDEPPTLSPPSPTAAGAGAEARRPVVASSPRRDSKQKSHTLDASTSSSRTSSSVRGRWSERELHAPQNTLPHARQWCLNPGSDPGNSRSHP